MSIIGSKLSCRSFKGSDGECSNISYSKSGLSKNDPFLLIPRHTYSYSIIHLLVPKNAKLRKWISREVNGNIFVWYHSENEEPWELPVDRRVEDKTMVLQGGNVLWVNCHIQEIPENGADAAHLMAVHGDTVFSGSSTGQRSWLWQLCGSHGWEANWRQNTEESQGHIAYSELKHFLVFFGKYRLFHVDIVAEQLGPGIVRLNLKSSLGDFLILQTVTPITPLLQRVTHRIYARRELFLASKILVFAETVMVRKLWTNYRNMVRIAT